MATPILRGNDEPIRQTQDWSYEWTRGGTYGETWKSINPNKMFAKWNGIVYTAQRCQMSVQNGVASLRVEWSGTGGGGSGNNNSIEVTLDRWECPEPNETKSIIYHPNMLAAIDAIAGLQTGGATDRNIQLVAGYILKGVELRGDIDDYLDSQIPHWSSFQAMTSLWEQFLRLTMLMMNNQESYQSTSYAVRHTTNAPAFWALNVADLNVNCIYSPAQFMSEVTDSSAWIYPLPGRLQYKLAAAVSAFSAVTPTRSNFLIGWRKGASSETTVARGRIEIQTNYQLDQWSTDLYPSF